MTTRTDILAPVATGTAVGAPLRRRPGRWIDGYDPEDDAQWRTQGRAVAHRNLRWSIGAEFLGFVVWQLWAITVVFLPQAGFAFSDSQLFWLISLPALVGATLRIPYTFVVSAVGGRNWTICSALLLLVPTIGLGLVVSDPATPFGVMLAVAATAGFGGGNFASSMANITYFFPAREKGFALGLNAAGGNLGAAVAQLVVPLVVTLGAIGAGLLGVPVLSLAGWFWVPLILVAAVGAARCMDNLSGAKGDLAGSLSAIREPHFWVVALLYIGTFGSFIGFSGVFPKLIKDTFPEFSTIHIGAAVIGLSFLGPLVGSLSRPSGGRLADRWGGARITVAAFGAMALLAAAVVLTLPLGSFWLFLALFGALFVASGIGNGATYRMLPMIYRVRGDRTTPKGVVGSARRASAALGLVSAVGAYGGFFIPQVLAAAKRSGGDYTAAFWGFVGFYLVAMAVAGIAYLRPGSEMARARV
ncbi:MFS transporter, NNP family, nitrate/nitrite transporter [Raineyella antarctica]|uniref:MFS transporter, NNP family, nitrate/nitrite transporter n=1 Tax=Raineyella antarctica TaxID=1577474 RepID=A0A1G6GFS1_9ACTN|nr:MFS transporter [Raineyella antarctica]SDB80841.1 MFS transporter, NNP family, nitrate/nitrite transporter [Raineyella antarctica]